MGVTAIRKAAKPDQGKVVEANQKAVDALPLNSGMWRVQGVQGLYVRCRAKTKTFRLERRIDGYLVKESLGELSVKRAKAAARKAWSGMKPSAPAADGVLTLGAAIEGYLQAKTLAPKTLEIARYNTERYLAKWKDRSLAEIGGDRAGVRLLQQRITRDHKPATSNQVMRLLAAVYRWHRKVNVDWPESPTVVAEIHKIPARDWAYSPEELRCWWRAAKKNDKGQVVKNENGEVIHLGVSTLGTMKRMWWLTALLTGARKGSVEALKWSDVDLDKKVLRFRVTKGNRPYSVPMSDTLAALLGRYQKSSDIPPSDWLFPSPSIDGAHLIDVKNPNEGVGPAHRLRHTFRTTLAELGITSDQSRMLMGHSTGKDVSSGYITSSLVMESLRPITNAVSAQYLKIIPGIGEL